MINASNNSPGTSTGVRVISTASRILRPYMWPDSNDRRQSPRYNNDMRFSVVAALCLLSLSAQVKPKTAFDKPTLETYLRHLLLVDPRVQVTVDDPKPASIPGLKEVDVHMNFQGRSQDEVFYASPDGKQVLYGKVFDIAASPFKADLDKIHTDLSPTFGAPTAPLTIVLYSDFQCPACKEEAKTIRENVAKDYPTQVRVYFKDFPLEQIHPWAKPGAIAGRCVYHQNPAVLGLLRLGLRAPDRDHA